MSTANNRMPVVNVRFKLPEEREEFEIYNKSGAMYSTIHDIMMKLRSMRKYENVDTVKIEDIEQIVFNAMRDNDVDDLF